MAPVGRARLGGGATVVLGLAAAALYAAPAFVAPSAGTKRHLGQQVDLRPTSLGRAQTARPITSAGACEEDGNSFSLGCRAVGAALVAFVCASAKRNGARKSFSVVQRRIVPSAGYKCKHKKMRTTMRWGGIPSWTKKPLLKKDVYRPWKLHVPKLLSQQRVTRWGRILVEKRRIAFHYNVQDRVLRKYMTKVMRNSDLTPHEYPLDKWFGVLESRLDNFLWRVGVAPTMATARYMITRGCIQIQRYNWDETTLAKRRRTAPKEDTDDPMWVRPNMPGCLLKIGDKVRVSRKDPQHQAFCKTWMEETGKVDVPPHLKWDREEMEGSYNGICHPEDVGIDYDEKQLYYYFSGARARFGRHHVKRVPGTSFEIEQKKYQSYPWAPVRPSLSPENIINIDMGRGINRPEGRRKPPCSWGRRKPANDPYLGSLKKSKIKTGWW